MPRFGRSILVGAASLLLAGVALGDSHADAHADSHADPAADLRERLSAGDRADADKARDADRKPADVVTFLGIGPGMRVIDLIASGGYYTEALAEAVGPSGRVYAQNSKFVLRMRGGANEKALAARLAEGRLPNVERIDLGLDKAKIEPASLSAALTALNFHDIYNGRGVDMALGFLNAVYEILEPGGVLGLIDHAGKAGHDNEKLHRIEESLVRELVAKSKFELEASSDVLRNASDDGSKNVFAPGMRGKTDRFVLRLRKPL